MLKALLPDWRPVNSYSQIRLKWQGDKLLLILPTEAQWRSPLDWLQVTQEFKARLKDGQGPALPTTIELQAQDRLLDGRQLQTLVTLLKEAGLQLQRVHTSRRQTAVAAATAGYAVEQDPPQPLLKPTAPPPAREEPLYLQTTVRSGRQLCHPGTIIIVGDLNPGGELVAAGDILVWGSLRGVAHAGADGDRNCRIMALRLEPTQLRIAELVARPPATPPGEIGPEVAYITPGGIRIARAYNFSKYHLFKEGGP